MSDIMTWETPDKSRGRQPKSQTNSFYKNRTVRNTMNEYGQMQQDGSQEREDTLEREDEAPRDDEDEIPREAPQQSPLKGNNIQKSFDRRDEMDTSRGE